MNKNRRIFIGTPMYGGMCTGFYTVSLLQTQTALREQGIAFNYQFVMNDALITRARNWLAREFLQSDCTHLLFIDADIRWVADDILTLIAADKDIICGMYAKKEINWHNVEAAVKSGVSGSDLRFYTANLAVYTRGYVEGNEEVQMDRPLEVTAAATGMMLIKREVLEKMKPHVATYRRNFLNLGPPKESDEQIYEFFSTCIDPDTQILLSEDYFFCDLWRKLGGRIWIAPWMRLGHQGSYMFEARP